MPVVSFANPKGGSGKTTSALLLACELALKKSVCIIDADPRHPITKWWQEGKRFEDANLNVISSDSEQTIVEDIERAVAQYPFVLIDLEGVASKRAAFAISQSDLVIIPTQEQQQDADEALTVMKEIKNLEKISRRTLPFSILFTRTKVIAKSRTARFIASQFISSKSIDCFRTEIHERDAFSALFTTGKTIRNLDQTMNNGVPKAIENVEKYAKEFVEKLIRIQKKEGECYERS